jgi:hypothetical protein
MDKGARELLRQSPEGAPRPDLVSGETFVFGKRRLSPIPVELREQLAILCDKALQAFDAKLCQRLVRRPDA